MKCEGEFMNQTKANTRLMHWMMVNQQHMNDMLADENPDYIMEHNHGVDNYMMMNRINKDSWQDTFLLLSDMRVKSCPEIRRLYRYLSLSLS